MKANVSTQLHVEKVTAGFFNGCNSYRLPWLLSDSQYRWGVNVVNRGGVLQSRPSFHMRLTLPNGNLQGFKYFKVNKEGQTEQWFVVFAVDGKVYKAPFPLVQPDNWEPYRFKDIKFRSNAKRIHFCLAQKSASEQIDQTIKIVKTHNVLMMQDGFSQAAFWDGEVARHTDENAPAVETPIGTWMVWSGSRLWVARGNALVASDIGDPISFRERISNISAGDFYFDSEITGLIESVGNERKSSLVVFTASQTSQLLSFITERQSWIDTPDFQTTIYPKLGCVSGSSIFQHAGLLWWYSKSGLVSSDSAASGFITSEIYYKDVEMADSKRNFNADLSGIAGASFENYMLVSVPSNDTYNSHTMVMDYAHRSDTSERQPPAWQGVWTGVRPVSWDSGEINGLDRLMCASVDYQATNGSYNHIWEAFGPDRGYDHYFTIDANNNKVSKRTRVYSSVDTKALGDGLDLKKFKYAELDAVEIGGEVDVRISFSGSLGGYNEIGRIKLMATENAVGIDSSDVQALAARTVFIPQKRRITTGEPIISDDTLMGQPQSDNNLDIDKYFSVRVQWCGRFGVEAIRTFTEDKVENGNGVCTPDEAGVNILTESGQSFVFPDLTQTSNDVIDEPTEFGSPFLFVSPFSPKYNEVLYSSIPLSWRELPTGCVTCLDCARDTFTPPSDALIEIDGKIVN